MTPEQEFELYQEQANAEMPLSAEQESLLETLLQKQEVDLKFNRLVFNVLKRNREEVEDLKKQIQDLTLIVARHHSKLTTSAASCQNQDNKKYHESILFTSSSVSNNTHVAPTSKMQSGSLSNLNDYCKNYPFRAASSSAESALSFVVHTDSSSSQVFSEPTIVSHGPLPNPGKSSYQCVCQSVFSTRSSAAAEKSPPPYIIHSSRAASSASQTCVTSTALPSRPLPSPNIFHKDNQFYSAPSIVGLKQSPITSVVYNIPVSPQKCVTPVVDPPNHSRMPMLSTAAVKQPPTLFSLSSAVIEQPSSSSVHGALCTSSSLQVGGLASTSGPSRQNPRFKSPAKGRSAIFSLSPLHDASFNDFTGSTSDNVVSTASVSPSLTLTSGSSLWRKMPRPRARSEAMKWIDEMNSDISENEEKYYTKAPKEETQESSDDSWTLLDYGAKSAGKPTSKGNNAPTLGQHSGKIMNKTTVYEHKKSGEITVHVFGKGDMHRSKLLSKQLKCPGKHLEEKCASSSAGASHYVDDWEVSSSDSSEYFNSSDDEFVAEDIGRFVESNERTLPRLTALKEIQRFTAGRNVNYQPLTGLWTRDVDFENAVQDDSNPNEAQPADHADALNDSINSVYGTAESNFGSSGSDKEEKGRAGVLFFSKKC